MLLLAALACGNPGEPPPPAECTPWSLRLAHELGEVDLAPVPPTGEVVVLGGPGVALADLDGDGWLDGIVALPVIPSVVLLNDGAGRLVPHHEATLDGGSLPPGSGLVLDDLDGDGDADAVLGTPHGTPDLLLWNEGDGLTWRSQPLPDSSGETFTPSLGDADGDGDLDLYVGRLAELVTPEVAEAELPGDANSLYLGQDGGFVDVSDRLPHRDDLTFGATWIDHDGDGDADLYQVNDFGIWQDPNRLLENDGSGHYTWADGTGAELRQGSMGAALGDADGDGWPDLHVTNVGPGALLRNDGAGRFYEAGAAAGVAVPVDDQHLASWGSLFADLDGDTWEDLVVVFGALGGGLGDPQASGEEYAALLVDMYGAAAEDWVDALDQRDKLFRNRGDGTFEDVSDASGLAVGAVGRSVALGDLDGDGLPDLVTAGVPFVRQFQGVGGCPPARLDLVGGPGNPHGIGARVEVDLPDRSLVRWLHPGTTFSQGEAALWIGLGEELSAEATVRFTDGTERTATLTAGATTTVAR